MDRYDTSSIADKLLQYLMDKHHDTIISFCEHDSFLIHHDDENLTNEEQCETKHQVSFFC